MKISKNILYNLNEKASIDWNNYLDKDEVTKFLSKDDKVESAESIIYDNNFKDRYQDFKKEGWTKRELAKDLSEFYYKGHLNEADKSAIEYGPYKNALGTWTIDLKPGYITSYGTNYIERNTRKECLWELENEVSYDESLLNEDAFDLWKNQINDKDTVDLVNYLRKLYNKLADYNDNNTDIKSKDYFDLLDKIQYVESKLGVKSKIGREIH